MSAAPPSRSGQAPVYSAADASVVICTYSDARWDLLVAAVSSALGQKPRPREVIVIVDHNPALLNRVRETFDGVVAAENSQPRGLSGARNTGIGLASGEIVAFLDDDATGDPGWLRGLLAPFADPQVLATGGRVEPVWLPSAPKWFPSQFNWVIGCSYTGQAVRGQARNPIGASMAFRRSVFEVVGGFRSEVGRVGTGPTGCEETELCLRALGRWPAGRVAIEETSLARHHAPSSRRSIRFFLSRCYGEGLSKAVVSRLAGPRRGLAAERTYVLRVLTRGVLGGIADSFRGDLWGAARAAAIVAGLGMTTCGYALGLMRLAVEGSPVATSPPEIATRESPGMVAGGRPMPTMLKATDV